MSDSRSLPLFDHIPLVNPTFPTYGATHVEARVQYTTGRGYVICVSPYSVDPAEPRVRSYPLSAMKFATAVPMAKVLGGRFNAKTLRAVAGHPETLAAARKLAGIPEGA